VPVIIGVYRLPTWSTLQDVTRPVKVMPETDKDPPTAEAGDEIFGNENDETGAPEDPSDWITVETPRLIYANRKPRSPCPHCQPYIDTIWQPGCQPRVPRHDGCYCYYQQVYTWETKNKNRFPTDPVNQASMDDKLQ
jgi:hypothetical protein